MYLNINQARISANKMTYFNSIFILLHQNLIFSPYQIKFGVPKIFPTFSKRKILGWLKYTCIIKACAMSTTEHVVYPTQSRCMYPNNVHIHVHLPCSFHLLIQLVTVNRVSVIQATAKARVPLVSITLCLSLLPILCLFDIFIQTRKSISIPFLLAILLFIPCVKCFTFFTTLKLTWQI